MTSTAARSPGAQGGNRRVRDRRHRRHDRPRPQETPRPSAVAGPLRRARHPHRWTTTHPHNATGPTQTRAIRELARANGYELADRGRIPPESCRPTTRRTAVGAVDVTTFGRYVKLKMTNSAVQWISRASERTFRLSTTRRQLEGGGVGTSPAGVGPGDSGLAG